MVIRYLLHAPHCLLPLHTSVCNDVNLPQKVETHRILFDIRRDEGVGFAPCIWKSHEPTERRAAQGSLAREDDMTTNLNIAMSQRGNARTDVGFAMTACEHTCV